MSVHPSDRVCTYGVSPGRPGGPGMPLGPRAVGPRSPLSPISPEPDRKWFSNLVKCNFSSLRQRLDYQISSFLITPPLTPFSTFESHEMLTADPM